MKANIQEQRKKRHCKREGKKTRANAKIQGCLRLQEKEECQHERNLKRQCEREVVKTNIRVCYIWQKWFKDNRKLTVTFCGREQLGREGKRSSRTHMRKRVKGGWFLCLPNVTFFFFFLITEVKYALQRKFGILFSHEK